METVMGHVEKMSEDDRELLVSHFIPSVELKGSKRQKLKTLDTLIAYLQRLRLALADDARDGEAVHP